MSNKRLTITFASIRHEDMKSFGTYEKARGLGNGGQSGTKVKGSLIRCTGHQRSHRLGSVLP